jgi:hypothetical protein
MDRFGAINGDDNSDRSSLLHSYCALEFTHAGGHFVSCSIDGSVIVRAGEILIQLSETEQQHPPSLAKWLRG